MNAHNDFSSKLITAIVQFFHLVRVALFGAIGEEEKKPARWMLYAEYAALEGNQSNPLRDSRDNSGQRGQFWAGEPLSQLPGAKWEFKRGHVCSVEMTAEQWFTHAETLTGQHPIRRVQLTTTPELYFTEDRCGLVIGIIGCAKSVATKAGRIGCLHHVLVARVLRTNWPEVAFHLPAKRPV